MNFKFTLLQLTCT